MIFCGQWAVRAMAFVCQSVWAVQQRLPLVRPQVEPTADGHDAGVDWARVEADRLSVHLSGKFTMLSNYLR